jgi:hypothetical protein
MAAVCCGHFRFRFQEDSFGNYSLSRQTSDLRDQHATEHILHNDGGLLLHGGQNMAVGVEGDLDTRMTESFADHFHVHIVEQ